MPQVHLRADNNDIDVLLLERAMTRGILTMLAVLLLSANVSAGVIREDKGDSDWEVLLAPYLWGSSLKGTAGVGPFPPVDVDASFSDIFENLNMALAVLGSFLADFSCEERTLERPEGSGYDFDQLFWNLELAGL